MKDKSTNLNTIPAKIVKPICDIISPCFNEYHLLVPHHGCIFPDSLKKARVPPMGDKYNLSNYRPISVLPVFTKVFEKVAYTQLYDYLENNSSLHKQQYGFRAKSLLLRRFYISCSTCIGSTARNGNVIFSLFLDFR